MIESWICRSSAHNIGVVSKDVVAPGNHPNIHSQFESYISSGWADVRLVRDDVILNNNVPARIRAAAMRATEKD